MKKLLIVCAFVFVAASLRPQDAAKLQDFEKGSWLFHVCQANIRGTDAPNGADAAEAALANECLDYFQGFTEGSEVSTAQFCATGSSTGTMVRVYVKYMETHPKLLDEHRVVGLLLALKENYPCPKPK